MLKFPSKRKRRILFVRLIELFTKVKKDKVVVVCKKAVGFNGNIRLVAEELSARGYDVSVYWEAAANKHKELSVIGAFRNVNFYHKLTFKSALVIASSSIILLSHSIRDGYVTKRKKNRSVVNLWHGVPIKGIELAMVNLKEDRERVIRKNSYVYDCMIASSGIDRLAMSACFGVSPNKIFSIGLPRYDLMLHPIKKFDEGIQKQAEYIKSVKGNRKLVLYAPTFREVGKDAISQIGNDGINELADFIYDKGFILAIRSHCYEIFELESDKVIKLTAEVVPETNLILRETDILITDFSSIWIDFLFLNRPVIGFAKDGLDYMKNERGVLYEFPEIFPGEFVFDMTSLKKILKRYLKSDVVVYHQQKQMFGLTENVNTTSYTNVVCDKILEL